MNVPLASLFPFFLFLFAPVAVAAAPVAVAVSIPPQKYFVERIAGSDASVTVLAAAGRDPHTYEPTAAQMRDMAGAEIYFTIGVPFEPQWMPKLTAINPSMRVVPLFDAVERLEEGTGFVPRDALREKDHHHHHGLEADDPHVWLSPGAMARTVPLMVEALAAGRPEHAESFRRKGRELLDEMAALEEEIRAMFASLENRVFLTFHQGWAYYAHNFTLREAGIEFEGREPGPRSMAMFLDFAAKNKARVIVVDAMSGRSAAEAVAAGIGGTIVVASPLAEDWPRSLREFSAALAAALRAAEERE